MRSRINALGGFDKIAWRGGHDVGQKLLRVAVIEWEPCALDLDFDAMAFKEGVVSGMEAEAVFEDLAGGDGFGMLEAFAVATAKNLCVDDKLIAGHVVLRCGCGV